MYTFDNNYINLFKWSLIIIIIIKIKLGTGLFLLGLVRRYTELK